MDNYTQEKPNIPVWVSLEEASRVLELKEKTLKEKCWNSEISYKIKKINKKNCYFLRFNTLSKEFQNKFLYPSKASDKKYSNAPIWAKAQADKYIYIIKETKELKGKQLREFILKWNILNPEYKTSYPCLLKMKRRYKEFGLDGLLARYGNTKRTAIIKDEYFDYFKNLYLVEGSPSLQTCWDSTLGYAMRTDGISKTNFPSKMAFLRKLQREIPKQSIYLARNGQSAWSRKFGSYIERDYRDIVCGKVWVSDHAQIDVACMTSDGNVVFPWVTSWRDFKSGKWLGWILQTGHPNSDHIFQTFYYAAENYGLPTNVIIDNGKDYRSRDFAGGRRKPCVEGKGESDELSTCLKPFDCDVSNSCAESTNLPGAKSKMVKVDSDRVKATSMLAELNVEVHFALPYNAQTKPIERDFLKIKELISKHCVGYRGGNVVERPEKLADEIKKGKILPFEKFKAVFDDFIVNVLNKKPSQGKNLKGLSPDELFNEEFKEKITTSKDALKLFCMRTSKNFTIGRNGIKDNQFGITYWADWMIAQTGLKVYLRRDVQNYKEAWAFRADNDEFVGKITAVKAVVALHADKITKEEFKEAMSIKKHNLKVAKAYIQQTREISIEEQCENYKTAYASVEKAANNKPKAKVSKIANTNMDKAIRKSKEMESFGKQDLSMFLDNEIQEEPLYLFETDKILDDELKICKMQ